VAPTPGQSPANPHTRDPDALTNSRDPRTAGVRHTAACGTLFTVRTPINNANQSYSAGQDRGRPLWAPHPAQLHIHLHPDRRIDHHLNQRQGRRQRRTQGRDGDLHGDIRGPRWHRHLLGHGGSAPLTLAGALLGGRALWLRPRRLARTFPSYGSGALTHVQRPEGCTPITDTWRFGRCTSPRASPPAVSHIAAKAATCPLPAHRSRVSNRCSIPSPGDRHTASGDAQAAVPYSRTARCNADRPSCRRGCRGVGDMGRRGGGTGAGQCGGLDVSCSTSSLGRSTAST
jgi:hypothetical protein